MKSFSVVLQWEIFFAQVCTILALNLFDIFRLSRCVLLPERWKPLTRAAGLFELWSLLALKSNYSVFLKYICPEKKLMFLFIVFFNLSRRNSLELIGTTPVWSERGDRNLRWVNGGLFNIGDDNEIRILSSYLLIKMAIYLKLYTL